MTISDDDLAAARADVARSAALGLIPATATVERDGSTLVVSGIGNGQGIISPTLHRCSERDDQALRLLA